MVETAANNFVSREVFDAYVQSINSRVAANEQLDDLRMERLEAIIDKNMTDINGAIKLLAEHVKQMTDELIELKNDAKKSNAEIYDLKLSATRANEKLDYSINSINEKLDYSVSTLKSAINNSDKRFDDFKEVQSKSLAKWAVAATLFIGAIQAVISIVLHFWK